MDIVKVSVLTSHELQIISKIKSGGIIIYPTDTIYGIGCNALDADAVSRLQLIKQRENKPFSIIAPSLGWIEQHCVLNGLSHEWISKLPGPYTFILHLKNDLFPEGVGKNQTVGVRMPDHWISEFVGKLGVPLVTTSVNLSGQPHLSNPSELDPVIAAHVDVLIDEGVREGKPSMVVDLTGESPVVLRR